VNQGHKKAADITHAAALSLQAGTDLSCSIWTPGFNTLADAVRQEAGLGGPGHPGCRAPLHRTASSSGLFDPQGSMLDKIPYSDDASIANRQTSLKAAEESIVLLKELRRIAAQARTLATSPSLAPQPNCCPPFSATMWARRFIR